ncbi:MAG: GspE/PulE family protein [Bacteroidota bacterium]
MQHSDEDHIALSAELQQLIVSEQAWHYCIVPKSSSDDEITFFIESENNNAGIGDELEVLFGKKVKLENCSGDKLRKTLGIYYRKTSTEKRTSKSSSVTLTNYEAEDFLNRLIREAKELRSSDIHIETFEDRCRVRLRIDGKLIERYVIGKMEYPALINKIKIKSNLDIAEKRLPQDGRIIFRSDHGDFDIRVSVLPTLHGEKVVLRLLSKDNTNVQIDELGFEQQQLDDYLEGIKRTSGIILISGPTGSGKTTTLYATLKILNKEESNVLTIEDPIEYTLEGVNQVQLKESIGLTFASALRTFLRQDPDIIMLGEIRDGETAQMAIRAALTGHLVLSTIHTNSAWGTISRLVDMGVPAYLLANTLNMSLAQRLVRLLCPNCKKEVPFSINQLPRNYTPPTVPETHFIAQGCEDCFYTGYKGRKAVYEVITINQELATHIKNESFQVEEILKQHGVVNLPDNAFTLVREGKTTIDEVYPILLNS